MRAEVDLADVVVLQHSGVAGVGGVVSGAVVEGAAGGEGQAGVESVLLDQLPGAFLQPLAVQGGGVRGRGCGHALVYTAQQRGNAGLSSAVGRDSPDFDHGLSGLHEAADVLADLSVRLGGLPEVVPHLLVGLVQGPPLLGTHPPHCTASGRGEGEG